MIWVQFTRRFDHWGAAESGLQLGEIETRYAACRYSAAQSGALIVFMSILFTAVSMPVQEIGMIDDINPCHTDR